MEVEIRAPIFIVGAPRSGTSVLYEKLALHRTARQHWRRYLQQVPDGNWSEIARQRLETQNETPLASV